MEVKLITNPILTVSDDEMENVTTHLFSLNGQQIYTLLCKCYIMRVQVWSDVSNVGICWY